MLMVPPCPEFGSLGRAGPAAAHELTGIRCWWCRC